MKFLIIVLLVTNLLKAYKLLVDVGREGEEGDGEAGQDYSVGAGDTMKLTCLVFLF